MSRKIRDLKVFGSIWALIFISISLYPVLSSNEIRMWALVLSLLFAIISLIKPVLLLGFYNVWMKIGHVIGGAVSITILFVLFFMVFTPIALFLKLIRKDLLNKKLDKTQDSYWIDRDIQPHSMKQQF